MTVLLITYDLEKPGQNYPEILKFIKSHGSWAKFSESSYAIKTQDTPDDTMKKLKPFLDKTSRIFVVTLTSPHAGFGADKVSGWLDDILPK